MRNAAACSGAGWGECGKDRTDGAAPMSSIRGQTGQEFKLLIAAAMTSRQMRVCATSSSPTHYASKMDWMVSKSEMNELSESVRNRGV